MYYLFYSSSTGTALCPRPITTSSNLNIPIVRKMQTDRCSFHLAIPIIPRTLKTTALSNIWAIGSLVGPVKAPS